MLYKRTGRQTGRGQIQPERQKRQTGWHPFTQSQATQTERQTDRQTGIHTYTHTYIQTDRQAGRPTYTNSHA